MKTSICILYSTALTIVHLNWTDKKCLGLQFNAFFFSCYALETWSKLSREKFYINDWSEGKQNLLRVRERFDLSRVRVSGSRLQCCKRVGSRGPSNFVSETTSKGIEGLEFFIKDIMIDQFKTRHWVNTLDTFRVSCWFVWRILRSASVLDNMSKLRDVALSALKAISL